MSIKRVNKELDALPYQYDKDIQLNNYILTITTHVDNIPYYINMTLDTTIYPFKAPTNIKVNNIEYQNLLASKLLLKIYKRCLCCETMLCKSWIPTNKLVDIINEINQNLRKLHRAREILCTEVIKRRYLFSDAPLEKYL